MPGRAMLCGVLLLLAVGTAPALAQPPEQGTAVEPETETPSLELLEFLADWESADGEWIDPEELEQIEMQDMEPKSDE